MECQFALWFLLQHYNTLPNGTAPVEFHIDVLSFDLNKLYDPMPDCARRASEISTVTGDLLSNTFIHICFPR